MIVIAISAILAIAAYNLVYGKISETDFQVSINNFKVQLQQIISNSAEGFHPTTQSFSCTNGYLTSPIITTGSSKFGSNTGCIFLGQAIKFNIGKTSYNTYSVVGNQTYSGSNSTSINQAFPIIINQTKLENITKNQLSFYCITTSKFCSNPNLINELVFLSTDSNQNIMNGINSTNNSNSQPLTGFYINNSTLPSIAGNITFSNKIYICLSSGSNNQSGLITISNQFIPTLSLKLYNNLKCQ